MRKEKELESNLPWSKEVGDEDEALANVEGEIDYEDYDDSGYGKYNCTIVSVTGKVSQQRRIKHLKSCQLPCL